MSGSLGYPTDFFKSNRFFYRLAGLWLYNPPKISKIRRIMQLAWTLSLIALSLCFESMEYMEFRYTIHDKNKFISQLGILLTRYVGVFKMGVLITQHRRLVQIEEDLQSETFRYPDFGDFKPAKLMTDAKIFCSRFTVGVYWMYTMIAVLSFVTTIAHLEYDNHEEVIKDNKTCYDYLPFLYLIPFDETTKTGCKYATAWLSYNIAVFAIFVCSLTKEALSNKSATITYFYKYMQHGHDALYFALIYCLKTQFMILCGAIRTMRERVSLRMKLPSTFTILHDEDHPELEKEMYKEIKFVSDHFSSLISITAELERAFTYQTFVQTLVTLIMMASCLFVISSITGLEYRPLTLAAEVGLLQKQNGETSSCDQSYKSQKEVDANQNSCCFLLVKNDVSKQFNTESNERHIHVKRKCPEIRLIDGCAFFYFFNTVPVNSVLFVTQAEYGCCLLTSATIFYWSGTGVITSSDDISQALYDSSWLSGSRRFKAAILITMARIQTPLYLTIGKFAPVTLSVSVAVCKASFSYYALFKSSVEE